jgi:20S proteasome subunit beta 7
MVDPVALSDAGSRQHTQYPYVTGTSVLAIKYKDGVMVACDTLGAYGSTKRYKSVERIKRINDHVVLAASGEISDFQYILKLLDELTTEDYRADDGINLGPQEVYAYLCRVLYNRRNKFDPLWNSLVVAGIEPPSAAAAAADASSSSHSFLGMVGMIGTHYSDSHVTTGFANHLARPLFRERQSDDMSEEAAAQLMYDALRVCYYRDKQSINKFQLAKVTKDGVSISEPFALDVKWDYKMFSQPTKWAVGAW